MNQQPLILFDGVCNFCNGTVNFIIRQDQKNIFHFATLQSATAQNLLKQFALPKPYDSSFLLIDRGKVYAKSTAALKVCNMLPWYWKWTQLFWLVPRFIRDGIYDFVAANRYKWFGRQEECMLPSAAIKARFLE